MNDNTLPYIPRPAEQREMTESQKRWLSWNFLVRAGKKQSYSGTVTAAAKAKRRAKNKVAKASRKKNR